VVYKFADDQGPYLAALITFYGFLSLFPLLLLLVTILGFVLAGIRTCRPSSSTRRSSSSR
jgi:membrane protein